MSLRKGDDVIAGGNATRIDSALNPNSINPVQNKAIAGKIQTIENDITALQTSKQDKIVAGDGIVIDPNGVTIGVGSLDCGTMS